MKKKKKGKSVLKSQICNICLHFLETRDKNHKVQSSGIGIFHRFNGANKEKFREIFAQKNCKVMHRFFLQAAFVKS